jgi:hypothetical protein
MLKKIKIKINHKRKILKKQSQLKSKSKNQGWLKEIFEEARSKVSSEFSYYWTSRLGEPVCIFGVDPLKMKKTKKELEKIVNKWRKHPDLGKDRISLDTSSKVIGGTQKIRIIFHC